MDFWAITDRGIVRRQNQDACAASVLNGFAFLLVCDGMGGANAGDVASKLTVTVFSAEVQKRVAEGMRGEALQGAMEGALDVANDAVYQLSLANAACSGMGTTVVCAMAADGEATVLNVGDSRAYAVSGGSIRQITRDHSVIEDMIRRGELTREESRHHPNKNLITRALGTAPGVECDFFTVPLSPGDGLLLCSDGLSNVISEEELLEAVRRDEPAEMCCKKLLDLALSRGAPDNVTVILYRE